MWVRPFLPEHITIPTSAQHHKDECSMTAQSPKEGPPSMHPAYDGGAQQFGTVSQEARGKTLCAWHCHSRSTIHRGQTQKHCPHP